MGIFYITYLLRHQTIGVWKLHLTSPRDWIVTYEFQIYYQIYILLSDLYFLLRLTANAVFTVMQARIQGNGEGVAMGANCILFWPRYNIEKFLFLLNCIQDRLFKCKYYLKLYYCLPLNEILYPRLLLWYRREKFRRIDVGYRSIKYCLILWRRILTLFGYNIWLFDECV